jgi:hypothetical protein
MPKLKHLPASPFSSAAVKRACLVSRETEWSQAASPNKPMAWRQWAGALKGSTHQPLSDSRVCWCRSHTCLTNGSAMSEWP